jgi:tRNA (guanine37-N1)-methyltransferase
VRVDVFTIFPELIDGFAGASLLGRAAQRGLLDIRAHDLRAGATDVHRSVDDAPFGGGAGMVLTPAPTFAVVESVDPPRPLYLLGPA